MSASAPAVLPDSIANVWLHLTFMHMLTQAQHCGGCWQVLFELTGDFAKSGVIFLQHQKNNFRRKSVDHFSYPVMPHLGAIKGLRVAAQSRGMFPGWRLRYQHPSVVLPPRGRHEVTIQH